MHEVTKHPATAFKAILEFLYLGTTKLEAGALVDLLDAAVQYSIPGLKMAIEQEFITNLREKTFYDTYMLAKGYNCSVLLDKVVEFGRLNVWSLRQAGILKKLDQDEKVRILKDNELNKPPKATSFLFMGRVN